MEQINYLKLKTGEARKNGGIIRIAFAKDTKEVRPVLYGVYNGKGRNMGTVQGMLVGDYICSCKWATKSDHLEEKITQNYDITVCSGENATEPLDFNTKAELWADLRTKHKWLDNFLEPVCTSEDIGIWIPTKVIKEVDYLSNVVKASKLHFFLTKFGISDFDFSSFIETKKADMQMIPRSIDLDIEETFNTNTNSMDAVWYGSSGNGRPATLLTKIDNWKSFKFIIRFNYVYKSSTDSHVWTIDCWRK